MWCICWPASGVRLFTSWEEFTGGLAPTSSDEHLVWVSQENRQHVLGHISLLGLKELVAPMCTGGANEDWVGGSVDALMADWAEECKKQGGLVIMPHMPLPDFENAANIVLGHADAGEMCWIWEGEQISSAEQGYYRWLKCGAEAADCRRYRQDVQRPHFGRLAHVCQAARRRGVYPLTIGARPCGVARRLPAPAR